MPGVPLFVVTHRVPDTVPTGDPPYTFVTDGIEHSVKNALGAGSVELDLVRVVDAPGVTHLTYRVVR